MIEWIEPFVHLRFLRPGWLVLVPCAFVLWWRVRAREAVRSAPPAELAPHLARALQVGGGRLLRWRAVDGVALSIALAAMATAGPTWSRVPSPFVEQTAPLVIVLATSESMLAADVAPTRLARAKHKLLDLLDLRAGARTALVAYAGTAHRVVPLTEDPAVLKPFVEGLSPEVMPEPGRNATAALALAEAALAAERAPGAILFILDALDAADVPAFVEHAAEDGAAVVFLAVSASREALDVLDRVPRASVVTLSPDRTDVARIERRVASAYRSALLSDDRLQWDDRGWVLAWPAALLTLLYFRRGWTMNLGLLLALGGIGMAPAPAQAEGLAETARRWLFTPDQRGRLAFEAGRYEEAAEVFEAPLWKGHALTFLGRYAEAAEVYARVATAEAACAQGFALVKAREYRKGIRAFEIALLREPGHLRATHNLEVAKAILAYLERAREESDTGEGSEGADAIVFDKEKEGGVTMTLDAADQARLESATEWMRTVETRTAEFLALRFGLEAAEAAP